jgi:hypothetical protein
MLHLCYTAAMSIRNPRIHAVLDRPLFRAVKRLADEQGFSLSEEVRDLVREAVELREDRALDAFAERRRKSFAPGKSLTPADVRQRLGLR